MQSSRNEEYQDCSLYSLLHVAEEDLRQAEFYATYLLKKGWHHQAWERRWTVYMQQAAFTTALATAYSRPFTVSRSWPKFPTRLLRHFDAAQRELHRQIVNLRNSVYAHSDIGGRLVRPFSLEGDPTAIERLPSMRFTREELERLKAMIKVIQSAIAARKMELLPQVAVESNQAPIIRDEEAAGSNPASPTSSKPQEGKALHSRQPAGTTMQKLPTPPIFPYLGGL